MIMLQLSNDVHIYLMNIYNASYQRIVENTIILNYILIWEKRRNLKRNRTCEAIVSLLGTIKLVFKNEKGGGNNGFSARTERKKREENRIEKEDEGNK